MDPRFTNLALSFQHCKITGHCRVSCDDYDGGRRACTVENEDIKLPNSRVCCD